MRPVGIVDAASHLPEHEVGREFFERHARPDDPLLRHPMFRAPEFRRYARRDETGADLIERAIGALAGRHGWDTVRGVDVLLTYNGLPDVPFLGSGAEVARRAGLHPTTIVDVHNGHCAVLPHLLDLATTLLQRAGADSALLCVAQTAGRIFTQPTVRVSAHASVPGDGAAVVLLRAGARPASPILATAVHHYPEYAPDVGITLDDGRLYWEPGTAEMDIRFDGRKAENVVERGTKIVPEVVRAACAEAGVDLAGVDLLITNQPNRLLLRNWARDLGIPAERHFDTFDRYGNLFGAGAPVNLDHALRAGRLRPGSLLVLAGFAGAGELAAAAVVRWGGDSGDSSDKAVWRVGRNEHER
ncbi:3-oxoacyl-[acyl-carrier-protein] synthase-3 [Amycolatopsis arida]|uniref:3-oxoacyl-[acyl-carrier-protein] synthase-3 n=1 Tax=Amycolatopsis arida TaxID=587909 RepID=A0A1I6AKW0_9PSEU|nr:3-oxoacyl-[acyl-carrier-protein] synthase III C-terminal domain-containing protein [Amycolatopsis arida]TDX87348.1 3-oxoacyl-[acyl-carrier-protein] synthase-3 [Amycolatopsis arida]SFQ69157.1 3-oxoacyl-[acyl-carrier-protein] synthase-3 [Amycolatopsis arida]